MNNIRKQDPNELSLKIGLRMQVHMEKAAHGLPDWQFHLQYLSSCRYTSSADLSMVR